MLVDSEINLSTRKGNTRVFIIYLFIACGPRSLRTPHTSYAFLHAQITHTTFAYRIYYFCTSFISFFHILIHRPHNLLPLTSLVISFAESEHVLPKNFPAWKYRKRHGAGCGSVGDHTRIVSWREQSVWCRWCCSLCRRNIGASKIGCFFVVPKHFRFSKFNKDSAIQQGFFVLFPP
jgi:hypothetical protein